MAEVLGRELGWEDEILLENEFEPLPEGDYAFKVIAFKRARYEPKPGAKLPPCNMAELEIEIAGADGAKRTVFHNLYLHTKTEGLLSNFFISIGQKKHGEPLRMNWNAVIGATGRCKVVINEWTNNKGETRRNNQISRFYDPEDIPKFRPGQF